MLMKMNKTFEKTRYICAKNTNPDNTNSAVFMRKKFYLGEFSNAKLYVAGLGYGYYFLNGIKVSNDMFTSAVSDYNKTVWYNVYDISTLLKHGENILSIMLGNGYFNENFDSVWEHNKAKWRSVPQVKLAIFIDGNLVVCSDESFKASDNTYIVYNQLRSGEVHDYRLYNKCWTSLNYDDSQWINCSISQKFPIGILRKISCPPVKQIKSHKARLIYFDNFKAIYDFGVNFAGYVSIKYKGTEGETITIRHTEEVENNNLKLNNLDIFYKSVPFQTDKFICGKDEVVFSPYFTYHGFRYIEITGMLNKIPENDINGIEVHQCLRKTAGFHCSDDRLNKLYGMAMNSTLSNMCYSLTDCPTREKLGWTNDAQASVEQILWNFNSKSFFEKWYIDILDTMKEDGSMAGFAPSPGCGYGNGPVCDGILYKIPIEIDRIYGDKKLLKKSIPYLIKYIEYINLRISQSIEFSLADWNGCRNLSTSKELITLFYLCKFITALNTALTNCDMTNQYNYQPILNETLKTIENKYITNLGESVENTITAISLIQELGLGNKDRLRAQLFKILDNENCLSDCGMVGRQYLFKSLHAFGLDECIYKILTDNNDIYMQMLNDGATSLYETVDKSASTISLNHHMYSCFSAWYIYGILGYKKEFNKISVRPAFIKGLKWAKGFVKINNKKLHISWVREKDKIRLSIKNGTDFDVNIFSVYICKAKNSMELLTEDKKEG